jgi:AraC-like DNA-binding protein
MSRQAGGQDAQILACTGGAIESARLRDGYRSALIECENASELDAVVRSSTVDLLIVGARDRAGRPTAGALRNICSRSRWPATACYVDARVAPRDLLALGNAGCVEIVVRDLDDTISDLRELPFRAAKAVAAREAEDWCLTELPAGLRPMALLCLESLSVPVRATELSKQLHIGRRALSKRASRVGFRGVSGIKVRCRLLVAASLLVRCRFSVESVALGLGYASAAHLRNTVKRYTGSVIGDLRGEDLGAFARLLFLRGRVPLALSSPAVTQA